VAVGIIDAHAGGLGSIGMHSGESADLDDLDTRLALISGTSTCHMAVSREPRFIPGVWGPYFGAMLPNMWLNEGGQSATGALIDHVIQNHAAYPALSHDAERTGRTVYEVLNAEPAAIGEGALQAALATVHVLPYFHGNRSPRADSRARGMISGLTLDSSLRNLALLYAATVQAIAYGTRHIIEEMNAAGYNIQRLHTCGGGSKNPLVLQQHADITACDVYYAPDAEPVLLGSAMLAAVAAGSYPTVADAVRAMSPKAKVTRPDLSRKPFHDAKYAVFKRMYEHQLEYGRIMKGRG
jgi:FGGY-family pentulose kinase